MIADDRTPGFPPVRSKLLTSRPKKAKTLAFFHRQKF